MTTIKGLLVARSAQGGPRLAGQIEPPELVPVANRPIVCHALSSMQAAGVSHAAVVAFPEELDSIAAAIESDPGPRPVTAYINASGSGSHLDALVAAEDFLGDGPVFLQAGDALLRDGLPTYVESSPAPLDALVLVEDVPADAPVRLLEPAGNKLLRRLHNVDRRRLMLSDFYLLGPGTARALSRVGTSRNDLTSLASAIESLMSSGARVGIRLAQGSWRFAGDGRNLLVANRFLLDRVRPNSADLELAGCEIEGRVQIDPSAELTATVVRGPAAIGPRARIDQAYIGPYTSIGADVLIEGAEIEYSIVREGASITHIGKRLEASIVGRHACVSRDFRLPHAIRLQVGENARVALT